jgi:hypothetical protein
MPQSKGKPVSIRKAVTEAAKAVESFIGAPVTEEERAAITRFFSHARRSQLLWWGSWYADTWDWPEGGQDVAHAWVEAPNPFSRYALLFLQDGDTADGEAWGVKDNCVALEFTDEGLEPPWPELEIWFAPSFAELEPFLMSPSARTLEPALKRLAVLPGRLTTRAEVTGWLSHESEAVREAAIAALPSIRIE